MEWNTENEEGQMVRAVDSPHKVALRIAGFEDKDISKVMYFPATKRELLDLLQVRIVVFEDKAELKAVFPVEPIGYTSCTSICRSALADRFATCSNSSWHGRMADGNNSD